MQRLCINKQNVSKLYCSSARERYSGFGSARAAKGCPVCINLMVQ